MQSLFYYYKVTFDRLELLTLFKKQKHYLHTSFESLILVFLFFLRKKWKIVWDRGGGWVVLVRAGDQNFFEKISRMIIWERIVRSVLNGLHIFVLFTAKEKLRYTFFMGFVKLPQPRHDRLCGTPTSSN